jgi:hypothetical protein
VIEKFELCPKCRKRLGDKDKVALLEHYAHKDVMYFQQYDGWLNVTPGDCIVVADECGDALTGGWAWELRSGIPVRIQILAGTPHKDAIRILKKMVAWIRQDGLYDRAPDMRPGEQAERALAWRKEIGEVAF